MEYSTISPARTARHPKRLVHGFVELSFAKPGMCVMVTHKFADAIQGALGVFKVG